MRHTDFLPTQAARASLIFNLALGSSNARFPGSFASLSSCLGMAGSSYLPVASLAVLVQQGRYLLNVLTSLTLGEQVVDVDATASFSRQHKVLDGVQMQQLRAYQARNWPIMVIGCLVIKLRDFFRESIFLSHGLSFHLIS
jgi:hypothetical protein